MKRPLPRGAAALFSAWAVCLLIWGLPLMRPAGHYLGHYQLRHLYAGIPVALVALGLTVVALFPPPRRRPVALRVTALLVVTLPLLLLLDAAFALGVRQAWRPDYWFDTVGIPRGENLPDPELGFVRAPRVAWRGRPNRYVREVYYRTDEHGFRNPPGVRQADLVFIGDSFTEATGVEEQDTFVVRTAAATRLSAVNLGRSAYGPVHEALVLRKWGMGYRPRVVVWQLFEGNDLGDVRKYREWRQGSRPNASFVKRYLDNSLLNLLAGATVPDDLPPSPEAVRGRIRGGDRGQAPFWLHGVYSAGEPRAMPEEMRETERLLAEADRACRKSGARLLVVTIPMMIRVLDPYLQYPSAEARRSLAPEGLDGKDDFAARVRRACARIGCGYLDTLPELRRAAARDSREVYFPGDQHLDVEGHRVVAETIVRWLSDTGAACRGQGAPGR